MTTGHPGLSPLVRPSEADLEHWEREGPRSAVEAAGMVLALIREVRRLRDVEGDAMRVEAELRRLRRALAESQRTVARLQAGVTARTLDDLTGPMPAWSGGKGDER